MDSIDEKRVYGEGDGGAELLIAASVGVVSVRASDGRVGEFGVAHRCSPRDVAARDDRVAIATDEDVLVREDGEFRETGFGPAVAVGFGADSTALLAAAEDGRIARYDGEWRTVGEIDAPNALDGDLVAADDGVYRVDDDLDHVGLDDVRDVATSGSPLAATADGLYALGNGWMRVAEGDFHVVESDGERAHAATADAFYGRAKNPEVGHASASSEPTPDGERQGGRDWRPLDRPVDEPVVGVAYADCPYAVTEAGTILAPAPEWRAEPLGLTGATGIAAVR